MNETRPPDHQIPLADLLVPEYLPKAYGPWLFGNLINKPVKIYTVDGNIVSSPTGGRVVSTARIPKSFRPGRERAINVRIETANGTMLKYRSHANGWHRCFEWNHEMEIKAGYRCIACNYYREPAAVGETIKVINIWRPFKNYAVGFWYWHSLGYRCRRCITPALSLDLPKLPYKNLIRDSVVEQHGHRWLIILATDLGIANNVITLAEIQGSFGGIRIENFPISNLSETQVIERYANVIRLEGRRVVEPSGRELSEGEPSDA